jgi:hypothetical protein
MVSFRMNIGQMRHIYTSVPEIRTLVNLWYDGPPKDLMSPKGCHMLRRLLIRAFYELDNRGQFFHIALIGEGWIDSSVARVKSGLL